MTLAEATRIDNTRVNFSEKKLSQLRHTNFETMNGANNYSREIVETTRDKITMIDLNDQAVN